MNTEDYVSVYPPLSVGILTTIRVRKNITVVDEDGNESEKEVVVPLDLESEDFRDWTRGIDIMIDGSIIAVDPEIVRPYISDPEVRSFRLGNSRMPKRFEIKTVQELHKILAHMVPLQDM